MSQRFDITDLSISGLHLIERMQGGDERGWFERFFCRKDFHQIMGDREIVQMNRSLTQKKAAVRGMHSQKKPHSEMKIVSCLRGEIFDVAVDLRAESPTFLQWHGEVLSESNGRSLVIPEGFAHGFQTLTEDCELLYLTTCPYAPDAEFCVHPCEKKVSVNWPLPIELMSEKDSSCPELAESFKGI